MITNDVAKAICAKYHKQGMLDGIESATGGLEAAVKAAEPQHQLGLLMAIDLLKQFKQITKESIKEN